MTRFQQIWISLNILDGDMKAYNKGGSSLVRKKRAGVETRFGAVSIISFSLGVEPKRPRWRVVVWLRG